MENPGFHQGVYMDCSVGAHIVFVGFCVIVVQMVKGRYELCPTQGSRFWRSGLPGSGAVRLLKMKAPVWTLRISIIRRIMGRAGHTRFGSRT